MVMATGLPCADVDEEATDSPAPWPFYAADERDAVARVLASGRVNYWTGEEGRTFEREYAYALGRAHGIALSNGTAALELALHALDVPHGSEVVTSPRTFIASASCAVKQGCIPVLADVDRDSQCITAASIERVLTARTRAIIAVHLAGWPCEMEAIMALARAYDLKVIEDCAQSNGATYRGRPAGALGDAAAFSFCQDKIITTGGEGGLLALDDDRAWERAWSHKDHGKSWEAVYRRQHGPGFRWVHDSFGTNARMTEMQAAIGRCQLRKLPAWTARRRELMGRVHDHLGRFASVRVPVIPSHIGHGAYKAYVFVRPEALRAGWSRDRILLAIQAAGAPCFSGSCSEIYRERAFLDLGLGPREPLPVAQELGETSLMFLVHPTLTDRQMDRILETAGRVFEEATR